MSKKGILSAILTFRVTEKEAEYVRKVAEKEERSNAQVVLRIFRKGREREPRAEAS